MTQKMCVILPQRQGLLKTQVPGNNTNRQAWYRMTPPVPGHRTRRGSQSLCCTNCSTQIQSTPPRMTMIVLMYFSEPSVPKEQKPRKWWEENAAWFPTPAILAKLYLSVHAMSTPSERLYSAAVNSVTKKKVSLTAEHVDMLTFLQSPVLLAPTETHCLRDRRRGFDSNCTAFVIPELCSLSLTLGFHEPFLFCTYSMLDCYWWITFLHPSCHVNVNPYLQHLKI